MSDATVVFDYNAEAEDELTLKEGDLIKNINKKEDGWWEGVLHGKKGMFPENFVKEIKRSAPESKQEKSVDKPTVSSGKTDIAKVTFDYEAENEDELSLKEGEIVEVLSQEEEGWWKGSLNGKVGVFPANFVEIEKGVPVPKPVPAPITSVNEEPVVKETPEKRAKAIGGIGFGGILTQDALSGIKLRKNKSGTQLNPIKKPEQPTPQSELRKKLSMKRNPPRLPDQDKPTKPSKSKGKAIVEFDYEKEQNDELTLCIGDVVNILESDVNEGWSRGELNGKVGLFPDNFVKLLPPEQPSKPADISKEMDAPKNEDMVDTKPSRPELPVPPKVKKPVNERPPAPFPVPEFGHSELPISLKPVPNSKPEETSLSESKPDERPPLHVRHEKPSPKKSPPLLPKKPDKPKLPGDGKDRPSSPPQPASKKPPAVILRHLNGLDDNPTRRFSTGPISEVNPKPEMKRHSQGAELNLNLNDIKSSGVLQPLTSDRPKNTAKSPPTKYGRPHSPKKVPTTEVQKNEFNETELFKESRETKKPAEKPKKPAVLESMKPKTESMVDSNVVKKLQDQINILKESVESIAKQFKEHVEKSEKKFQKSEKKLIDEIEDLTKELDEEKKSRSAVEVEVKRLTKLIKNQQAS